MVASGEKKEEYRIPSKWILSRLNKEYDCVTFRNGYRSDSPSVTLRYLGWHVGTGKAEWGAEVGRTYLVIRLGEIISPNKASDQTQS